MSRKGDVEAGNAIDLLDRYFDRYLPSVVDEIRAVIRVYDSGRDDLFGLLRYHLGWVDAAFRPCDAPSGKRMRPMLCLLVCEGCGGDWKRGLPAAAAVELVHNFSLIHDDIQDRDATRRGRPTVWSIWGEAQGINAGDAMFAIAQLAMLRLREQDVPLATILDAARVFNETCVTLTRGQYLDIGFEGRDQVSVDEYVLMTEGKTAALVACSCELGALIAGARAAKRKHMRAFGHHLGLAFQMQDDVLGIWGDSNVTGKPVGNDIARRKKSLPLLHGLERNAELRSLLGRETISAADVRSATRMLEEAGSRAFAADLARQHHDQALAALFRANLKPPVAEALRELGTRLLNRRR